ncbi:MAG: hypothetical protein AAF658_02055, partial [Myxococcota bacterium]
MRDTERQIFGQIYNTRYSYDSVGRFRDIYYPHQGGRQRINYVYTGDSVRLVRHIPKEQPALTLWERGQRDRAGRLEGFTLGNGRVAARAYDPTTGRRLEENHADAFNEAYEYTSDGVLNRIVEAQGRTEEFEFDYLSRPTQWNQTYTGTGGSSVSIATEYDYHPSTGNLELRRRLTKAGEEARTEFLYDGGHQIAKWEDFVGGTGTGLSYAEHDSRGRRESSSRWTAIVYTSFDLPRSMESTDGSIQAEFLYDAFGQRVARNVNGARTITAGAYRSENFGKLHIHAVMGPEGPIAELRVDDDSGESSYHYLHRNYRGDTLAVS